MILHCRRLADYTFFSNRHYIAGHATQAAIARRTRYFLPDFIIHPPVVLKDGRSVVSLDQAAEVVAACLSATPDEQSTSVLHRLQGATTMPDAADATDAFRQWAADKNLMQKR